MSAPSPRRADALRRTAIGLIDRITSPAFRASGSATVLRGMPEGAARTAQIASLTRTVATLEADARDLVASTLYASGEPALAAAILPKKPAGWLVHAIRTPGEDPFVQALRERLREPDSRAFLIACEAVGHLAAGDHARAEKAANAAEALVPKIKGAAHERGRVLAVVARVRAASAPKTQPLWAKAIREATSSKFSANNDAALELVIDQLAASKVPPVVEGPLLDHLGKVAVEARLRRALHRLVRHLIARDQSAAAVGVLAALDPWDGAKLLPALAAAGQPVAAQLAAATTAALAPHSSGAVIPERVLAVALAHHAVGERDAGSSLLTRALALAVELSRGSPWTDALDTIAVELRGSAVPSDVQLPVLRTILATARELETSARRCALAGLLIPAFEALRSAADTDAAIAVATEAWTPANEQPGARPPILALLEHLTVAANAAWL